VSIVHSDDANEITEVLLGLGAEINAPTTEQAYTPLHLACGTGRMHQLTLLLGGDWPLDVNATDTANVATPMHLACSFEDDKISFELASTLLLANTLGSERVADDRHWHDMRTVRVDQASADGLTPLHVSAAAGNVHSMLLLLHFGAKPDLHDIQGATPLHLAVFSNQNVCARGLIAAGKARIDRVDHLGATPLHVALRHNSDKARFDFASTLVDGFQAQKRGRDELARFVNMADHNGLTALHIAATNSDHLDLFRLLLDSGADPNIDTAPLRPLEILLNRQFEGAVDLLMSRGAAIDWSRVGDQQSGAIGIEGSRLSLEAGAPTRPSDRDDDSR
jgi:ankyrin repeat protein